MEDIAESSISRRYSREEEFMSKIILNYSLYTSYMRIKKLYLLFRNPLILMQICAGYLAKFQVLNCLKIEAKVENIKLISM